MPDSSILGGDRRPQRRAAGRDADALGPSDSSDSGSDIQGATPMATDPDQPDELGAVPIDTDADTDRTGTGERASATSNVTDGADILPDRVAGDPTLADHELAEDAGDADPLDPEDLAAGNAGADETSDDEAPDDAERAPSR